MEIYILRDGKETGPHSEEDTQRLLKQGDVRITDLAWKKGMQEWIPLHSVLYPAPETTAPVQEVAPVAAAAVSTGPAEPATAKQKAFLSYIGVPFEPGVSREQAALLVNDAMENPRDPARLVRWNVDRLKLHPELFAEEIQARKEQRTARFFELTQSEGAKAADGVTKAHCQVLVNYLDVKYPNWDANEREALWNYFLPAVREKFPQLIRKDWKDKLKFPQGPKVAPELKRRPAVAAKVKGPSPFALVVRGMAVTLILIGLAIGAVYLYRHPDERAKLRQQGEALIAKFSKAPPRGTPVKAQSTPSAEPVATNEDSIPAEPKAPETPADKTAMTDTEPALPSDSPMVAAAPSGEATPSAPPAPAASESLFGPPTTPPATSGTDPAMAPADSSASLLPGPKTHVTLIEPVKIETPYGPMEFRRGMTFPLVSQEGVDVTVRFQGRMIDLPASSTDLAAEAPAPQ